MLLLEDKIHLWIESSRFVKAKPGVYVLYDIYDHAIEIRYQVITIWQLQYGNSIYFN